MLYLFIYFAPTGLLQTHSGLKREKRREKKERKKMLPGSFLSLGLGSATAVAAGRRAGGSHSSLASRLMRQAAGQWGVGSQTRREGGEAKVQLRWDGPQPWRDAAPNLMPPPSFSGKCPCPSVGKSQLPFPMAFSKTRPCQIAYRKESLPLYPS